METKKAKPVLIGVVNRIKDLEILLSQRWYRIPVKKCPKRKISYLAFYQTGRFGQDGKKVRFYARVISRRKVKRKTILPGEPDHPRKEEFYYQFRLGRLQRLLQPVHNRTRRRVSFAFTFLERLLSAREISEIFEVSPIEELMEKELLRSKIPFQREYPVFQNRRLRYRLDFAIIRGSKKIAVECDRPAWHSQPKQRKRDRRRDAYLKSKGWKVLRFTDQEILRQPARCRKTILNHL
ncbi:MAG: DUF559 domain-containing protein [Candidatus Omnitrophota bacterium]